MSGRDTIEIEISEELTKKFESLRPAAVHRGKVFSAEENAALLKYWPVKNHEDIARALGICTNTALKQYRNLLTRETHG